MTTIAIIGAGAVGSAVGSNWAREGHTIVFGVRDATSERSRAALDRTGPNASAVTPREAAAAAEVVVLAVPWHAAEDAVRNLGNLDGKLLIDATNPLAMGPEGLSLDIGHLTSGAEKIAEWAVNARVVKSLNQVGAEVMANPEAFSHKPVMFVAGDDADARAVARDLVADLGFDARDAGRLQVARLLEPFAMTWIHLALNTDQGREWAFSVTDRI
ncbi:MAG: NAD(P)-binding domain-containing protein [Pseudomonadota bacterium]